MKLFCFSCRKLVRSVTIQSKHVLYELDVNQIHRCSKSPNPEEIGEREDEDSSTYHRAQKKKAA